MCTNTKICNLKLEAMHNILISVIAALRPEVFDMDKPVIFTYEEILYSTDGFSDSNLLGHGTYGSIYHGLLREQVCVCILKFVERQVFCQKI